ncbi:hypothetical protein GpartN1_g7486.t1 [Galdieria partita]|uniref:Trimethylguanosine synthase n=1 Tax=Galdieria partita TaxID=83374 RepID=A0A9C7Q463_9RHOD|nr:hypothetical protein GpartN1_g7486.t1 [Galdieria partita]
MGRKQRCKRNRKKCKSLKVHPKYIGQRFRLFSKFEQGISLSDPESWYSVLPEKIASHVASRCRCDIIVDPFAGAGGSCIQLATTCTYVIAIENVYTRLLDAKHNAEIYDVANKIDFILGDAFQIFPSFIGKVDVMFIAPPWGGPNYENGDFFNFGRFQYGLSEIVDTFLQVTDNLAISLPRSSSPRQIASTIPEGRIFEVEYNYLNDKCKTITVYLGSLVKPLVSSSVVQQTDSMVDTQRENREQYPSQD